MPITTLELVLDTVTKLRVKILLICTSAYAKIMRGVTVQASDTMEGKRGHDISDAEAKKL